MGGIYVSKTRGTEEAYPIEGKDILEKNQLRLSGPRQGPHGDRGLLRIGKLCLKCSSRDRSISTGPVLYLAPDKGSGYCKRFLLLAPDPGFVTLPSPGRDALPACTPRPGRTSSTWPALENACWQRGPSPNG